MYIICCKRYLNPLPITSFAFLYTIPKRQVKLNIVCASAVKMREIYSLISMFFTEALKRQYDKAKNADMTKVTE